MIRVEIVGIKFMSLVNNLHQTENALDRKNTLIERKERSRALKKPLNNFPKIKKK